ncbi:GTP binding protein Cdc42 [Mycena sanguinolenta]|uniref:GTP binding protein Cdc42 n=1 Tax=Mycena sanguinolenta TaxID=230812 RepID=A0A8H7CRV0_9AGAR|nr:GTP binding protein Cdc42 [Mycena sanguinolenta]
MSQTAQGTIKCTLIGDYDVGKTCPLTAYSDQEFPTEDVPTVSGTFAAPVVVRTVPYILGVFDTYAANLISFLRASSGSSDPESDRLRPLTYPETVIFIVCFSVGSATSLSSVKDKWIPEAIHHCPGVPCVIAATQIDLRPPELKIKFRFPWQNKTAVQQDQQEGILITTAGGKKLTRELNAAAYVECSAKTLKGVQATKVRQFWQYLFNVP